MNSWFIYALLAMFAFGGMSSLFKIPAAKGYDKYIYSSFSFIVGTILSLLFFYKDISFNTQTISFGFVWGTAYALFVILQMIILKKLDTSESFPITSLGSYVLVVIIGVTFFNDTLSPVQIFALIATFLIIGFYNHINKHITFNNGLIPIAAGIVLLSTLLKFTQKLGSVSSLAGNFIFWQLFFATIASIIILFLYKNNKTIERKIDRNLIAWSVLLGGLNFIGTVAIVKALSTGPFSLVYTIISFYILVSSIVAWKLFGEKLNRQKVVFILLAVVVIVLIRLG